MTTAIIFDTETTGLAKREPVEVAYVEVVEGTFRSGSITGSLFKPAIPGGMEWGALAVHHIIPADLVDAAPSTEAAAFLPPADYLIGHNVDFDWEVLGKPAGRRICTLALARREWPELDSHTQSALYYYLFGANEESRRTLRSAHSATADVRICYEIFLELLSRHRWTTFEEIWRASEAARIPQIMGFGKYKGKAIKDVPKEYVSWYRRQEAPDPYYLMAFSQAGK